MKDHSLFEFFNKIIFKKASFYGFLELVKLLVEKNVKIDQKDRSGNTSLIIGILSLHFIFYNVKNKLKYFSVLLAASKGYKDIVLYLLNKKANINAKNNNKENALMKGIVFISFFYLFL